MPMYNISFENWKVEYRDYAGGIYTHTHERDHAGASVKDARIGKNKTRPILIYLRINNRRRKIFAKIKTIFRITNHVYKISDFLLCGNILSLTSVHVL